MRDAIEMFEFAEHNRAWSDWVASLFRRLRPTLLKSDEAFASADACCSGGCEG